jgi:hypothetical protein
MEERKERRKDRREGRRKKGEDRENNDLVLFSAVLWDQQEIP